MQLTNGISLSKDGFNFYILGNIGNSFIVFGDDGCKSGKFKLLVQVCFLNFIKLCGMCLYLQFQIYIP